MLEKNIVIRIEKKLSELLELNKKKKKKCNHRWWKDRKDSNERE